MFQPLGPLRFPALPITRRGRSIENGLHTLNGEHWKQQVRRAREIVAGAGADRGGQRGNRGSGSRIRDELRGEVSAAVRAEVAAELQEIIRAESSAAVRGALERIAARLQSP